MACKVKQTFQIDKRVRDAVGTIISFAILMTFSKAQPRPSLVPYPQYCTPNSLVLVALKACGFVVHIAGKLVCARSVDIRCAGAVAVVGTERG